MTPQKIPTSGRNDHEDLVIKKCRDCNGTGKGTVPGSRCGSCGGSGQSVTVVHRR